MYRASASIDGCNSGGIGSEGDKPSKFNVTQGQPDALKTVGDWRFQLPFQKIFGDQPMPIKNGPTGRRKAGKS